MQNQQQIMPVGPVMPAHCACACLELLDARLAGHAAAGQGMPGYGQLNPSPHVLLQQPLLLPCRHQQHTLLLLLSRLLLHVAVQQQAWAKARLAPGRKTLTVHVQRTASLAPSTAITRQHQHCRM